MNYVDQQLINGGGVLIRPSVGKNHQIIKHPPVYWALEVLESKA